MKQGRQICFLQSAENRVVKRRIQINILPGFAIPQFYTVCAGLCKSQDLLEKSFGIAAEFLNLKSGIAVDGESAGQKRFQKKSFCVGNAGGSSVPDAKQVHAVQTGGAQVVPPITQVAVHRASAVGMYMSVPNSLIMSHEVHPFLSVCVCCSF